MKKIVPMFTLIVVLAACMFTGQKLYPFPGNEITVAGDAIYCGGKPFAKLMTLDWDREETLAESPVVSGIWLVIHYYDNDKEVWIYPRKKLSIYQEGKEYTKIEDMQQVWSKFNQEIRAYNERHELYPQQKAPHIYINGKDAEKEDLIRSVVFDVRISEDGKYVYYKSQGILWNSSHKYLVEYGVSD